MMLPQLESFATSITKAVQPPKRFLALYVGHGFAVTPNDAHPSRRVTTSPNRCDHRPPHAINIRATTGQTDFYHSPTQGD